MDNFKAVFKILTSLEKAMDYPAFDTKIINHESLGVSKERWCRYIEMMSDMGLIKGVRIEEYITGDISVDMDNIRITLKGLEYLQENSIMQRLYKQAKGLIDLASIIK